MKLTQYSTLLWFDVHGWLNRARKMLKAVVFVRRNGASGAGHVGWAFEYGDNTFNVGAVENTQGYFLDGPMQMAFWTQRTAAAVAPMKIRRYDEFKLIKVQQPNPSYAWQIVQWVGHHWYSFAWHNCMDSTYDVLRAFGVPNLPPPILHWLPNVGSTLFKQNTMKLMK